MLFATKERVLKQLTSLAADSIELERQGEMLAKRFEHSASVLGRFDELTAFRRELSDTTEGFMIAGEAVLSGRVAPKAMAKNLPMFRRQIDIYRQTITGMIASVMAFGAAQ
jgi:hypothetical protein